MTERDLVALPCKLSRAAFSTERGFDVVLANGQVYGGIAPKHFCWTKEGVLIEGDEATEGEVDGFVAAKRLDQIDETDQFLVEVPDAMRVVVRASQIVKRPTKIVPPGPNRKG